MINLDSFVRLGNLPTPLESNLPFCRRHSSTLHLKRDDYLDTLIGGTKLRALGYILRDAIEQEVTDLITVGETNSNQCRMVACLGSRYGMRVHLLLKGERPQDPREVNCGFLLTQLFSPDIVFLNEQEWHFHLLAVERLQQRLRSENRKPYFIPFGCVNWPGPLGIINLIRELYTQNDCRIPYSHIVVPVGSGGTLFGMDAAFQVLPELRGVEPPHLVGISLYQDELTLRRRIDGYYRELHLRTGSDVRRSSALSIQYADGMSAAEDISSRTLDIVESYGLVLDPVYLVQPFCALLKLVQKGTIPAHSNILFIVTGHSINIFSLKEKLYRETLKRSSCLQLPPRSV